MTAWQLLIEDYNRHRWFPLWFWEDDISLDPDLARWTLTQFAKQLNRDLIIEACKP